METIYLGVSGMIQFAAHLEMNFTNEVSFQERWKVASKFGYQGCEFVWRHRDLAEVIALSEKYPMQVSCLGGATGFEVGGGRPLLTRREDREQVAKDVETAVTYAQNVNCKRLIFVPGNLDSSRSIEQHREEAIATFKYVAPILEEAGVTALLEPLNSLVDHKGIYCDNSEEAFRIIDGVGSENVKVIYDIYHMQIMDGNLIQTIQNNHDKIGYYHLAKVPGRVEPVGGEVNVPAVIEAIRATGYDDFIGLEYKPSLKAETSFSEIKEAFPTYFGQFQNR